MTGAQVEEDETGGQGAAVSASILTEVHVQVGFGHSIAVILGL